MPNIVALRAADPLDEARLIGRVAELMRKGASRDTVTLADHFADTIDTASRQSIAVGLICVLLGAGFGAGFGFGLGLGDSVFSSEGRSPELRIELTVLRISPSFA